MTRALALAAGLAGTLLSCGPESASEADTFRRLAASAEGVARVEDGLLVADGVVLRGTQPIDWRVDLEPGQVLTFVWRPPSAAPGAFLVVRCEDQELLRRPCAEQPESVELRVPLPPFERRGARLRLALENAGGDAQGLVLRPGIGPAEAVARPRAERMRPDVLLVLVDTLRADALGVYRAAGSGATADAPPTARLDAFAGRSLRFECRSSATWTLPSISSLFTARAPLEHGAYQPDHTLGASAVTLAEVLAQAGYRTAAITDSVFVSRLHGLDQGFEWFEEVARENWDLSHTLERADALLAEDDGRPLFLFVHTYRVHKPYRSGLEEDAGPYDAAWAATEAAAGDPREVTAQALREAATYRQLYGRGVAGLDDELGPWLEQLEAGSFLERGLLVLTSDHGEAFGEKKQIFHRGHPFESETRVPLLVRSARLAPGAPAPIASLVDLPRTIASWCAVPPAPSWWGQDLLHAAGSGRAFSWTIGREVNERRGVEAALVEGRRKVLVSFDIGPDGRDPDPPRLRLAFDLAVDPLEEHDLAAAEAWPMRQLEALRETLVRRTRTEVHGERRELGADERSALDDLGYADSDVGDEAR